jgi:hypothetical protein
MLQFGQIRSSGYYFTTMRSGFILSKDQRPKIAAIVCKSEA